MTSEQYKARRKRLGLSQEALAALVGVTKRTIIYREQGGPIDEEARLAIMSIKPKRKSAQSD